MRILEIVSSKKILEKNLVSSVGIIGKKLRFNILGKECHKKLTAEIISVFRALSK